MPKEEREFFDPATSGLPWRPVEHDAAGLVEQILSHDPETGDYTRLLRFPPGADTSAAGTLQHEFWEEVLVLEGAIHDLRLDKTFSRGMYACRPPGMPHGPWRSPDGALTFEIRYGHPLDAARANKRDDAR
jgi:hypothetical protein